MRIKLAAVTAGAVLALGGCGSDGGASDPMAGVADLPGLAKVIGCWEYVDASADSPLTKQYGACQDSHGSVSLYQFAAASAIETFWQVSEPLGGDRDACAAKGLFIVCPSSSKDLAEVKARMGLGD